MLRGNLHIHCAMYVLVSIKNIDTMHHLYVFVSQRGGGGGGEKRLVSFLKKISVFTDDP